MIVNKKTIYLDSPSDRPRPAQPGVHSDAGPAAPDHRRLLAARLGAGQRGDRDADATDGGGPGDVPSLLAGRGLRALSHLRGASGLGARLVRRLPRALVLPEESAHRGDPHRHPVPLPLVAPERCAQVHQEPARVP